MPNCKDCGKSVTFYATYCYKCFHSKHNPKGMLGKKHTEEGKRKCRLAKLAEKNPMWRGDKVQYFQLHTWIKARIPKPKKCECCKKVPPYDLANKGIYDRNLKNWEWLCRKCHMMKDGRIKNLHSNSVVVENRKKATRKHNLLFPQSRKNGRFCTEEQCLANADVN